MKLELKHLSAYLPYNLRLIFEKSGRIITMMSCYNDGFLHIVDYEEGNHYDLSIWDFKPILRPLSDFVLNFEYLFENDDFKDISETIIPNSLFTQLCKEHFDVFGLIDAGLAVDINTLTSKSIA